MDPRTRSAARPLALVMLVAVLFAACSPTVEPSATPTGAPTPSTSPAPTPTSGDATTIVRAYFFLPGARDSEGLVPVLREVPETEAVATAAMHELLEGPNAVETSDHAMTSAIPEGSSLLGLAIEDGVATVDLSSAFESGGGSLSILVRLAQVVYTLTQFPTVEAVAFRIEGRPVTVFSAEGIVLDGPVGRSDYEDLLPLIWVDQPAFGAELGNPGRISGSANTFEAAFLVTLLDTERRVIVEVPAMATCGTGCRGTFDVTLPYDVPEPAWGTLRVWAGSAQDGSPVHVREYPVWLTPAD